MLGMTSIRAVGHCVEYLSTNTVYKDLVKSEECIPAKEKLTFLVTQANNSDKLYKYILSSMYVLKVRHSLQRNTTWG